MKLENQVLNIEQVRELQELGFDVGKYASMKYIDGMLLPNESKIKVIGEPFRGCNYPTLTIGDIMEVLPKVIPILDTTKSSIFSVLKSYILQTDMKNYLRYKYADGNILLEIIESTYFINMLFDALKWCIKNKHIAL